MHSIRDAEKGCTCTNPYVRAIMLMPMQHRKHEHWPYDYLSESKSSAVAACSYTIGVVILPSEWNVDSVNSNRNCEHRALTRCRTTVQLLYIFNLLLPMHHQVRRRPLKALSGLFPWAMALSRVLNLQIPLLFLLHYLILCPSATTAQDDRAALLAFKAEVTSDPGSFMASWNTSLNVCQWPGVACNDSEHRGRVSHLNLDSLGLVGVISPSISNLTYLNTLHLGNNSFYGGVPLQLSRLGQLSYLNLSFNDLNGTIPASISLCTNLTRIDFTYNFLSGSIPSQLDSLVKLLVLNLGHNNLASDIPPSFGKLNSLQQLDLSSNKLTDKILPSLGNLFNLSYLDLSNNKLDGGIPTSFGNLSSIGRLNLAANQLTGAIPPEMSKLSTLTYLDLSNNTLFGEIPSWMGSQLPLTVLALSYNKLTGSIPDSLGMLANLTYMDLSSNGLTGPFPASFTNLSALQVIDLSYNNLEGSIPEAIGHLKNLEFLQLNQNRLSGDIPLSLFNITALGTVSMAFNQLSGTLPPNVGNTLPNLIFLGLASNKLEGPIPMSLGNATLLEVLDLSGNNFSGRIPANLGNLVHLNQLSLGSNSLVAEDANDWEFLSSLSSCTVLEDLSLIENKLGGELPPSVANLSTQLNRLTLGGNRFHGTFPLGIRRYTNLNTLSLNDNNFTGTIPDFLGELVNLEALILYNNQFSGTIPSSLGKLTRLNELLLDHNSFHGTLPASLGNCQNLNTFDVSSNQLSGAVPKEVLSIRSLSNFIDMSNNYFTGELPREVGKLSNIPYISFSSNNLSGNIPSSIGDCQVLQFLNLSRNFFDGDIPSELKILKGLKRLDLSFNNLSGSIPAFLGDYPDMQKLDLSFNDLSGEVPESGNFKNSSIFSVVGNPQVCGGVSSLNLPSCSNHKSKKELPLALKISLPILALILLVSLLATFYFIRKAKRQSLDSKDDGYPFIPTKLSYLDLAKATDDFSSANLIGVGSYGSVYRGIMGDDGEIVAVKVIDMQQHGAFKSFIAEIEALRNIRHRNLVKIISTCVSVDFRGEEFRAILLEFMPNGSLENWLHPEPNGKLHTKKLGLVQRLNIAIDVAAALNYLHDHCVTPIVHCDLKPSNVLLDGNMTARVGDFGIARFIPQAAKTYQSSSVAIKGSIGYMAPEYGIGGRVSTQADVYSYGVLLLELFTGKRPTDDMFRDGGTLQKHVKENLSKGVQVTEVADPSLFSEGSEDVLNFVVGRQASARITQCLESVFMVGVNCTKESPGERIRMANVVTRMETIKNILLASKM
ncbi:putative LRR receptor-like serine/threonine-protein kinase [Canna indica]|uniref:Receptor kinase-like protein Xa21 n=1 Tax=Canna indica TaxID=4628 RepID=A0AAQ3KUE0_9LILI|nr:putative LRR receptor-like serine/threonine-protein kinase [Canna indica]